MSTAPVQRAHKQARSFARPIGPAKRARQTKPLGMVSRYPGRIAGDGTTHHGRVVVFLVRSMSERLFGGSSATLLPPRIDERRWERRDEGEDHGPVNMPVHGRQR